MDTNLLEHVKGYLRIDGDFDDEMLGLLIDSAIEYLTNAGVSVDKNKESKTYQLAITMLVTHWYENREQVIGDIPNNLYLGLQSIILQLKAAELDEFD